MKKLKLESLEVTSFETAAATPGERGTVYANESLRCTPFCTMLNCPTDFCTETCRFTNQNCDTDLTCPLVP